MSKSLEDYLETILILKNKMGSVRSVDVARYMNFSKPSVSHAVKELRKKGYLEMEHDGSLVFTENGEKLAKQVYERHCLFKQFLIHVGVMPELAEKDACQIEHIISEESYQQLKKIYEE